MLGADAVIDPFSALAPSTLFNLGGWLIMGILILLSVSRGWLVPKSQFDKFTGDKDKAYADMVALKDEQYKAMLLVKNDQLADLRAQVTDWKSTAGTADARADQLAANQDELMAGVTAATRFIEGIYHRSGGGAG